MFTSGRLSAYLQYAYSFVAVQVLVQHGRRLPVERLVKRSAWIAIAHRPGLHSSPILRASQYYLVRVRVLFFHSMCTLKHSSFRSLRFVPGGNIAYRWHSIISTACGTQCVLARDIYHACSLYRGLVNTELRHPGLASGYVSGQESIMAFYLTSTDRSKLQALVGLIHAARLYYTQSKRPY